MCTDTRYLLLYRVAVFIVPIFKKSYLKNHKSYKLNFSKSGKLIKFATKIVGCEISLTCEHD
jgi:hypothetical protein